MNIVLQGRRVEALGDYGSTLAREMPSEAGGALAMCVGGETLPLNAVPSEGDVATVITYENPEGRRVYERSLRFVFLLAMRRLFPGARVRLEHSFGNGVYAVAGPEARLDARAARRVAEEMRAIVEADLPFRKRVVSRREAVAYFERLNMTDKVRLLRYRPYEHFQMYECDGMLEYFYGVMTPSTRYTPVFDVSFYMPGLVVLLPDPARPDSPSPLKDMPKLMATFAETARWNAILGCENVADLNERVEQKSMRELIRVSEALQARSIAHIADRFVDSGARVLLVAGPSSSGKTTLSHRLNVALRVLGLRPMKLSLDNYYLNRDEAPIDEFGERDFERLDALDVRLFNEQLISLLQGDTVQAPVFDFQKGARADRTEPLHIGSDQPVIIEGIHALNDELTRDLTHSMKYKVYVSALTALNLDDHNRIRTTDARLLRRVVRDFLFRGTLPSETLAMWPSVRRGEEKYIFPYQEQADVMFNSSLAYELNILKKYAYPMLSKIEPSDPQFTLAGRLLKFLNYVQSSNAEDEIPPNSILREFIGGCSFYREET